MDFLFGCKAAGCGGKSSTLHNLFFAALLILNACISSAQTIELPSLGDGSSRLISPELEKQIGQMFLRSLNANLPMNKDPLVQNFVEEHARYLAQYSDLERMLNTILVVDEKSLNAFAAPGGVAGVNLGLILNARDISEYSWVIAHELAHLSQRHFARGVEASRASTIPILASMIGAILVGAAGGSDAGLAALSAGQAAAQAKQLRHSRAREIESDRIGLNTMLRANLDLNAGVRMLERMQSANRFRSAPPEFLLTHPLSETRITDAKNQARALQSTSGLETRSKGNRFSQTYKLMRARVEKRFSDSPLAYVENSEKAIQVNPSDVRNRYAHALSLSLIGKHNEAVTALDGLEDSIEDESVFYFTKAELLLEAEEPAKSLEVLELAMQIHPDHFPISMIYAQTLNSLSRFEEAERVLADLTRSRPNDTIVWFELAETAGLAGNISGVHLARAQFFELMGAWHRSIQHLEYAQNLLGTEETIKAKKIDQQIFELRKRIRTANS